MKRLTGILAVLLLTAASWAQHVAALKVLIPIIAKDSHSHPVSGLTNQALVIKDQKTRIANFDLLRASDLPLELGILIDTSQSQRGTTITEALNSAKDFVNGVVREGADRVFFLTFSETPEATQWLRREDLAGLTVNVNARGRGTTLFDSIGFACRERMGVPDRQNPSRRVLVVISDGEDNASRMPRGWAISEVLKYGVLVFGVNTQESPLQTSGRGNKNLEQLAAATGGETFTGMRRADVPKVFARIKGLLDGMYYARYVPPRTSEKVHDVDIRRSSKMQFELFYPAKYVWIE